MFNFKTQRLILRNLKEKDLDNLYNYRNDPLVRKYQSSFEKDLDDLVYLYLKHKDDTLNNIDVSYIGICLKNDELIGEIKVMPFYNNILLGYSLDNNYQRKGFAFEALNEAIKIINSKYPKSSFLASVENENDRSINLLKKLGFKKLESFKNSTYTVFKKEFN